MAKSTDRSSRRGWLRGLLPPVADAAAGVAEAALERAIASVPPQRRPPGAVAEPLFLALCTRCTDCSDACPASAIFRFNERASASLQNTPVMLPDSRACLMCDGFPCAAACEPRALVPPTAPAWRLGAVRVDTTRCIAWLGPECGACQSSCPGTVGAISMQRWRPVVDEAACVGCGICIADCPTDPPAIVLLPLDAAPV